MVSGAGWRRVIIARYGMTPYRGGVSRHTVDTEAARALLVERGLGILAANEFLMRSLLTASEAATVLGVKDSRAARDTLRRWGIKPIGRGPGRTGENTYPAELVWLHHQNRPGRGWRKGRSKTATVDMNAMDTSTAAFRSDGVPWYADHHNVISLASILVDADRLDTPREVIYYFEDPWKWSQAYDIWVAAGRPQPPSPDDLAEAQYLGPKGTLRHELEHRYQDDTARWSEFIESLDAAEVGDEQTRSAKPCSKLSGGSGTHTDSAPSNVLPLRSTRQKRRRR